MLFMSHSQMRQNDHVPDGPFTKTSEYGQKSLQNDYNQQHF